MKRQLRTIAAAAALAASCGLAFGQAGTTPQPGNAPGTTAAPSTPPTHPTERTTPSTRPATQDNSRAGGQGSDTGKSGTGAAGTSAEAMQMCKNLSSEQERKDCMDRARSSRASTDSSTKSETGSRPNTSGTSGGKWSGEKKDSSSK
jgi:hypothetical protein